MNDFDNQYLKWKLDAQDTAECFYPLIGHIIAKHENIDQLLRRVIQINIRDIVDDAAGRPEHQSALRAIFDQILMRSESSELRKIFYTTTSQWFLLAKERDPEAFTFTQEHLQLLPKVFDFETGVRNIVAHSSFEFSMRGLTPEKEIDAVIVDKNNANFKLTKYQNEDFQKFCRFQRRLEADIRDHLYRLQFGPGICSAADCKEIAAGDGSEPFGANLNKLYNDFLVMRMTELLDIKMQLDNLRVATEWTESGILTPI